MSDPVDFSKQGAIGVITINNPPVNALSQAVRKGIHEGVEQGLADDEVTAMVLIGGGRTFVAGADIREFGKPLGPPDLLTVIATIEASPKLVVAALHGTPLGGGLELALGCHYRCALASTRVGLPEVKLGLLPGAGGTQRLPRVAGIPLALKMITSGDPIPAAAAKEAGIVDEIVEGDLLDDAVAYANKLVADGVPLRKIRDLDDKLTEARDDPGIFDDFRKGMAKKARGYLAPWKCVDSVENAVKLPFDEGQKREREIFTECMASTESKGQIHAFFSEREVAKIPDVPKDTPIIDVGSAAVLGAGTMGGGIAMNFVNAGIPVHLLEVNQEALDHGLEVIRANYASTVSKGRLSQEAMDKRMALIHPVLDYDSIKDDDIVVEAVFEEMDIKKEIFRTLDQTCKQGAILATNTSTLDVDEIAAETGRPEAVIGLHFFSPANVMRLLEIVRGDKTSKEVIATSMKLAKAISKVGVLVGVCDGFVGNRMLHGYSREANFLVEEGALPQQVDKVIYDFGFPMGPFAMGDMAGLDIGWRVRKRQAATRNPNLRYSPLGDKVCELGRFGQKTGAGWYRYEAGSRTPIPDPEIEALIIENSDRLAIERREVSDQEILERCMYPLVNVGAQLLEEGIALRSLDIDIIYIYGYGFPPYRGGPMFWADTIGVDKVYEAVSRYHEQHGPFWEPAPLLKKLAEEGKGFGDL
jgi:3-hydroxyacyl-CoA dehydrogenase